MKRTQYSLLLFAGLLLLGLNAAAQNIPTPPRTFADSTKSGNPTVTRAYYDDEIAIYFSEGIDPSTDWMNDYIREAWQYTKQTYAPVGDPRIYDARLYVFMHEDSTRSGATIASFSYSDFGYRNVMSLGSLWDWSEPNQKAYEVITHELAHIVEFGSNEISQSPSFVFWGDGPWPNIFTYDVYRALGRDDWAQDWFDRKVELKDGHLGQLPEYYFFRDWFYPLYDQYGGVEFFQRYFTILSENYPTEGIFGKGDDVIPWYQGDANYGEVLHFMSAAAGVNLREQYTTAFGWSAERAAEFREAQQDYPLPYEDVPDEPESESQLVQAEGYTSMQGVRTEPTQDAGGGRNVSHLDAGDVLNYAGIELSDSGAYTIEYRVASRRGDSLEMRANGRRLGTVTLPRTGGWQNWQTVRQRVNLNAGSYTFRIVAKSGEWNINWWRITYTGGDARNNLGSEARTRGSLAVSKGAPERVPLPCRIAGTSEGAGNQARSLLYPNPARNLVRIKSANSQVKAVWAGADQQHARRLPVTQQGEQAQINVSLLPPGTHLLLIERADGSKDYQRLHKE